MEPDPPPRSRDLTSRALTDTVLQSFDGSADERLRTVMRGLVEHLHAFAADVGLTEAEWEAARRSRGRSCRSIVLAPSRAVTQALAMRRRLD
jgi:hypothetical protein